MHKDTDPFDEAWDHGYKLDRDYTWYHPQWPEYQATLEMPNSHDIHRYRMSQWRNKGIQDSVRPAWRVFFINCVGDLQSLWSQWTKETSNKLKGP